MLLCLSLTDWLQQALLAYHVVHMFLDGVSSFHEVSPWALPPQFVRPTAAHSATKGDVGLGWKIGFPSCVSFSRESVSFTTHTGNYALTPVLGGFPHRQFFGHQLGVLRFNSTLPELQHLPTLLSSMPWIKFAFLSIPKWLLSSWTDTTQTLQSLGTSRQSRNGWYFEEEIILRGWAPFIRPHLCFLSCKGKSLTPH